jgi:serine/threonine protein kinase
MGRHVAVKVLPRAKATPESEAAFRREVRILGRLDHENLVRAFDAGYDAMVYYLVTELVAGLDMRRHVRAFGPIGETEAASVFVQVAKALSFAHEQRLIHRDVKPGNIIVMDDGRAKLLDLGLAGSSLEEEAIRLGRVVGTMDYIAPEQIRSPDDVGPPADVYALGCTLYFAITGRVPFPGGTRKEKMQRHLAEQPTPIRELAPQVSPAFCSVVEAMMAKSEGQRIGSAAEVIARLRPWTPEHTVPLPRLPAGRTPRPAAAPGGDGGDSWGSHGAGESSTPGLEADTSLLREPPAVPPPAADWQERLVAGVEGTIGILANPRTAVPTLVRGLIAAAVGAAVIAGVRSASSEWSLGLPAFVTPATCGFTVFVVAVTRQVVKRLESRPRGTREPR